MAESNPSEGAPAGRLFFSRRDPAAARAPASRLYDLRLPPPRPRASRPLAVRLLAAAFALACVLQLMTACDKKPAAGGVPEAEAGRAIFMSHCISCHNVDPSRDGSLGPAIKGSSLELLQARVMRGEYPPGYSPKRTTRIMVRLPLTEEDVAKVHKFLNAP